MDDCSEGSLIKMDHARCRPWRFQKQTITNSPLRYRGTIDILPEDILLGIFDYHVAEAAKYTKYEEWQVLVHVCQKWRYVVFRSPVRLNLRILCSAETPVRKRLAIWPPLPIFIRQYPSTSQHGEDNIIAALGHADRVVKIHLTFPTESILAEMQKTFVALEDLELHNYAMGDTVPLVISDSYLGGSAPQLRRLSLFHIQFPFPVLRNLLLSGPNLVLLSLSGIPHSSFFSPEAIVSCLSTLIRLETLDIRFQSPRSRPPREGRHSLPTRSVLPVLTELRFIGVSEYLEDLVTRIDVPLLHYLDITFFHQLIFDTSHASQLVQFISRTPKLNEYDKAHVTFSYSRANITLIGRDNLQLELGISCRQSDWQLSSLTQFCTSSFPRALISMLGHLYMFGDELMRLLGQEDLESTQWLEFFHPFTTVKNLYLSQEFASRIAPTLQALVGESVTEVLPNLQGIFLESLNESGQIPMAMQQLISARQLSGRPITISHWTR